MMSVLKKLALLEGNSEPPRTPRNGLPNFPEHGARQLPAFLYHSTRSQRQTRAGDVFGTLDVTN